MRNILLFILVLMGISNAKSQSNDQGFKALTQEQYKQYFPIETQIAMFVPTTDFVCILPTNEKDTALQKEVNTYYKEAFIKKYPTVPHQITRVVTDKEALKEDLSNLNIHSFGTVEGNLWTAQFMKNAKDFPVKITSDSIITDTIYRGKDYMVTALWYNPDNYKHSLTLYIPQNLECAKSAYRKNSFQYTIWHKGEKVKDSYYHLRDHNWHFSRQKDTMLIFRDVNHLNHMMDIGMEKIDNSNYRFPSEKQLLSCKLKEYDVQIDTIKMTGITKDFSNLTAMEWLRPVAENYKIVAVGESHHLRYNKYLLERILFSLNTFDYYPLLMLELPYSFTGYFNYYLSMDDDKSAQLFYDSVLSSIDKPDLPLLALVRNWNKEHPKKKIKIGCSDLEQAFTKTIKGILNPYLIKVKPDADISFAFEDSLKGYLVRAKEIIERAKKENAIGEFSFQTPQYIESVYENLKSSIPIKLDRKNFMDHTKRFAVMIRNVTDSRFLGKQVADGKSVFYGGSDHFRILNGENEKRTNGTEGYFLAHSFEPTKDKIYTILLQPLGISIEDSIQRIDPNLQFNIETNLIKLYKAGKIKLNEPVIGPFTDEIDRYIYKLSYKYTGYAMRINRVNIDSSLNRYEGFDRFFLSLSLNRLSDFNTNIIIPYTPVGD